MRGSTAPPFSSTLRRDGGRVGVKAATDRFEIHDSALLAPDVELSHEEAHRPVMYRPFSGGSPPQGYVRLLAPDVAEKEGQRWRSNAMRYGSSHVEYWKATWPGLRVITPEWKRKY